MSIIRPTTTIIDDAASQRSTRISWAAAGCLLVAVLGLFGPALSGKRIFAFRDTGHFYLPLWEWARAEWGSGRIPLWNPLQNLGVPHFAESTSSVFYPGKILFALPGPFELWFNVFLAGHVVLAGYTTFRLLRGWQHSPTAAGLASVSYALSGAVLFQYCNPPFLIGAAWLPLAVGLGWRCLERRTFADALRTAAVLAIIVLGGDAQTAYHVGLMLVLLAIYRKRNAKRAPLSPLAVASQKNTGNLKSGLAAIALVAFLGIFLAAVQILPTAESTATSVRAQSEHPRSLDELALFAAQGRGVSWKGILVKDESNHLRRVYDFSVGPWRWPELIWPNFSGKWFPVNARWIQTVRVEGRTWSPSLYVGLFPIWLAASACLFYRQLDLRSRWIICFTLLAILASMGSYGIGWLLVDMHRLVGGTEETAIIGRPVGSLYWFMTVALPGFVKFRYPAKLWTIATFGFCILAGIEWDRRQPEGRSGRTLALLAGISVAGALIVLASRTQIQGIWSAAIPTDRIFGPLDVDQAWWSLLLGLTQTAMLALVFRFLFARRKIRQAQWAGVAVIALTTIDLYIAHAWMLPSTPVSELGNAAILSPDALSQDVFAKRKPSEGGIVPTRIYRTPSAPWRPESWSEESSEDRLTELIRWDRETLYPQHSVATGQSVMGSTTTITDAHWSEVLSELKALGPNDNTANSINDSLERRLSLLGVDNIVRMSDDPAKPLQSIPVNRPLRVWLSESLNDAEKLTEPHEDEADWVQPSARSGECRIVSYSPQQVVVEVDANGPATLVMNDQWHPGWKATIRKGFDSTASSTEGTAAEIRRVNDVMRAIEIPESGKHRVEFRFQPTSFRIGAMTSAIAWLLAIGYGIACMVLRRTKSAS